MQRDALLSHLLRKEEGSDTEGVSVTMDIKESDVKEKTSRSEFEVEEESKDSPRSIPQDWADQVEEKSKEIPRKESDIKEEKTFRTKVKEALWWESKKRGPEYSWSNERLREFVQGLKWWQDIKPRRVQAMCACVGRYTRGETQLSFEPGALMTAVRPALWLKTCWLEGALDGRVGLIYGEDVNYLD